MFVMSRNRVAVIVGGIVLATTLIQAYQPAESTRRYINPRTKADATRKAREQVEAKLEKLRSQRKKLQQRARGLRHQ